MEEGVKKEDFLLVIQTQYQMEVLKTFGGNVVCMDATHGTNIYDFYLVTIVVIDEYVLTFPCEFSKSFIACNTT